MTKLRWRVKLVTKQSPDLNPIEPTWAKAKAELRRAEARSLDQLDTALPNALDRITSSDA